MKLLRQPKQFRHQVLLSGCTTIRLGLPNIGMTSQPEQLPLKTTNTVPKKSELRGIIQRCLQLRYRRGVNRVNTRRNLEQQKSKGHKHSDREEHNSEEFIKHIKATTWHNDCVLTNIYNKIRLQTILHLQRLRRGTLSSLGAGLPRLGLPCCRSAYSDSRSMSFGPYRLQRAE